MWIWLIAALALGGVAVVLRLLADRLSAYVARKGLAEIKGYRATFDRLHVSLHDLSVTTTNFKLTDESVGPDQPPLLYAESLEAHLLWRDLLTFDLGGRAIIDKLKLSIYFNPHAEKTKPDDLNAPPPPVPDFGGVLGSLVPFRVDRLVLRDCELLMVDTGAEHQPRGWAHDIEATLENVTSRRHLQKGEAATLALKATIQHSGKLTVSITADPQQRLPTFSGEIELKGQQLSDFAAWFEDLAQVNVTGIVDCFGSFKVTQGEVAGELKPVIKQLTVRPSKTASLAKKIIATGADFAAKVLSDGVPGRDAVVSTIPITGKLTTPDIQLWPAVFSVLRNAFVMAIRSGFSESPPPSADEKAVLIQQAKFEIAKEVAPQPTDATPDEVKPVEAKLPAV